jgi:hypothetical protein
MLKYLSAALAVAMIVSGGCSRRPAWTYQGNFHAAIAEADRMVVIDAGFDCYGRDTKAKVLVEVSKPDEIRQFAENIEFQKGQTLGCCPCNGYPRVDWYQGKQRLATVSIQHGQAIRWKGFQADAKLTSTSSRWLVQWLTDHGVDAVKMK